MSTAQTQASMHGINCRLSLYNRLAAYVTFGNLLVTVIIIGSLLLIRKLTGDSNASLIVTIIFTILCSVPLILCMAIVVLLLLRESTLRDWRVLDEAAVVDNARSKREYETNKLLFFVPSVTIGPAVYIVINLATTWLTYIWLYRWA